MHSMVHSGKKHILTIALEDYFHGPAFSKVISDRRWSHFETRFETNCQKVLDRLDKAGARATFFANAWVARQFPEVLREVISRGHEIGLAGPRGQSFRRLTRGTLREQVQRDRDVLEHATGVRTLGYRVLDLWMDSADLWALEELSELGFRYDSSLSPIFSNFKGEPWRQHIHENQFDARGIWEVPLSSGRMGKVILPFAGGNYFRQYPEWLIERFISQACRNEHPMVLYFRLWDFDLNQPRLKTGSWLGDFRHYRNSERVVRLMNELLAKCTFLSIANYLNLPSIPATPTVRMEVESSRQRIGVPGRRESAVPVSVIVPCFNEAEGIPFLASNLNALRLELQPEFDAEFLLVDDGSRDQTWRLLQQYFGNKAGVKLLRHTQNKGVSGAIMTGLQQAREIACSIDCDCSYDPNELRPMLTLLGPEVDLVTASPYHPNGKVLNVPGWRLLLSRAASMLYRVVTGKAVHTFTACVRVYRRSSVIDVPLRYSGFLGVGELLGKMAITGGTIVEHPATLELRIFGQSKMKILRTILGHLRLLGELAWLRVKKSGGIAKFDVSAGSKAVSFVTTETAEIEAKKS